MSLVGFKAQNHRQQTARRGALERVDDRRTPDSLWTPWHDEFGFTLDAAASAENAKCERYFTLDTDGLAQSWRGERVWCNPPYSDCGAWVAKANSSFAALVAMLLPANRTEQGWWQAHVEGYRRLGLIEARFLPGRIRFDVPGGDLLRPARQSAALWLRAARVARRCFPVRQGTAMRREQLFSELRALDDELRGGVLVGTNARVGEWLADHIAELLALEPALATLSQIADEKYPSKWKASVMRERARLALMRLEEERPSLDLSGSMSANPDCPLRDSGRSPSGKERP